MKKLLLSSAFYLGILGAQAQGPAVTSWLQNTTGIMGRHWVVGASSPTTDAVEANVQTVEYSANWVYIHTHGIPAYVTAPFQDGNPSLASDQGIIFKIPLAPTRNTGTPTPTTMGNIGVFINGVAMFDPRDGVSWKNSTGTVAGGPIPGGPGDGVWNRDAIVAERVGFDCSKGHPARGNYHHHQNPSAFDLDKVVISTVCNLYPSDALYVIDSTRHSPLLGFAYDGFPVYGPYAYLDTNGTGPITRMKSGYSLRSITTRTTNPAGTSVTPGPPVSVTYPLGYFQEDYQFSAPTSTDQLDAHNGRWCRTPEYPGGTYCYFATVDANWNSAYPYLVGPTFYGVKNVTNPGSVSEATTVYTPSSSSISNKDLENLSIAVYPNPSSDVVAVQLKSAQQDNFDVSLYDMNGRLVKQTKLYQGSTLAYFDLQTVYAGEYFIRISNKNGSIEKKITIVK